MVDTGINWKGVAFWIVLAVFLFLVLCYFMDWLNVRVLLAKATSALGIPKLGNINLSGVTSLLKDNAALIGIATPLAMTAIGYYIKNWQANKLLDKQTADYAVKISQVQKAAEAKDIAKQTIIDELNSDTTATELQTRLGSISDEVFQLKTKNEFLVAQNQELMSRIENTPVKIVTQYK